MISSIVLAAGMSTRMGQLKALLDWGGEPLVCYQVRQLREAGADEVIVVLGYRSDEIHRRMKTAECRVMLNPRFHTGRAGSLRIGAKASDRNADPIVVVNVDQPATAAVIRALLEAHAPEAAATRPVHDGRHGHPIVVAGALRPELLEADEAERGLDGILKRHAGAVRDVPAGPECLLDLNTPGDYESAHAATHAPA